MPSTLYHVAPREHANWIVSQQGLRYGSDGVVYLWPTLELAEDWADETGGLILKVNASGLILEADPYMGVACAHRGDIEPGRISYA
jgi:hypothetical protein